VVALARQIQFASFGNLEGVADGFGHLGEQVLHLFRAAQVVSVVVHAHAIAVAEQFSGLNAKQNVLQFGIVPPHIVHIIGRHYTGASLLRKLDQAAVNAIELGNVVILQLEEVAILAKHIQVPCQAAFSAIRVVIQQSTGKFSGEAGR